MESIIPQDDTPQKRCSACKKFFPATPEFFRRDKAKKDGLSYWCKLCKDEQDKTRRQRPEVRERERNRKINYRSRPEVRARERVYKHTYRMRPEVRERRSAHHAVYRSRPEVRARRNAQSKAYHRRPEVRSRLRLQKQTQKTYTYLKAYRKIYRMRPEVRERQRDQDRARYQRRKEQCRVYSLNRYARKQAAPGRFTAQDVQKQRERQKNKCYWCHEKLIKWHIDHIVPLSREGSNWPDNIVIACPTCNLRRNNKLPHEFFEGGKLL